MDRHQIVQRFAQIGEDAAAKAQTAYDRGEAIVQQNEIGRFSGYVGAALSHRDANIHRQ